MENKCSQITYLGEFRDRQLENEYFKIEMLSSKKYFIGASYVFAILFLLFYIPDFFLNRELDNLLTILVIRLLFIFFTFSANYFIKKVSDANKMAMVITIYLFTLPIAFYSVIYFSTSPDFLLQTMWLVLIVIVFFSVPNKMINLICLSVVTLLGFFILIPNFAPPLKISHYSASIIYAVLTLMLCSFNTYRGCYIKRTEYLSSMNKTDLLIRDHLTGIFNRLKFEEELHKWFEYSKRSKAKLSIILLDIDNFKTINDSYGHLTGDYILKTVVNVVLQNIREYDVFARWGGEEFVLLLPNTSQNEAIALSKRICNRIENTKVKTGDTITCSFGVNTLNSNDTEESFLNNADVNLYEAKNSGKNCVKY